MFVRQSIPSDAYIMAPNLRAADLLECEGHGIAPVDALKAAYQFGTENLTGIGRDGTILGMCGIGVPIAKGVMSVWMLGTDQLFSDRKYRRYLHLRSGNCVDVWVDRYGSIGNVVHSENLVHIRWLEKLGFTLFKDNPHTAASGAIFYPFIRTQNYV